METPLDKGREVSTIFIDLSKAFDTLNHNLLRAKLNVYGFSFNVIKYIQSYLSERFQRVDINSNFREWCKTLLGVQQGSFLSPILFNIIINDFPILYKMLIFAILRMIIHYIQLRIISKKLKLYLRRTFTRVVL